MNCTCTHVGAVARSGAAYGQGLGLDVVLQDLACDGHEARVADCGKNNVVPSVCPHSRDAGVVCQPMLSRKSGKQFMKCVVLVFCNLQCIPPPILQRNLFPYALLLVYSNIVIAAYSLYSRGHQAGWWC